MAFSLLEQLFAGLFLFAAGAIQLYAPYQAAKKAAMEEGNEEDVSDEWEIDAAQIAGAITGLVGLAIVVRAFVTL